MQSMETATGINTVETAAPHSLADAKKWPPFLDRASVGVHELRRRAVAIGTVFEVGHCGAGSWL